MAPSRKTRKIYTYGTVVAFVVVGAYAALSSLGYAGNSAIAQAAAAAQAQPSPSNLQQLMIAKNLASMRFVSGDWAYYVEPLNPGKVYIAGLDGTKTHAYRDLGLNHAKLKEAFEGKLDKKDPDLMIIACGPRFGGDNDGCDYYSVLNEPIHAGAGITQSESSRYARIVSSAVLALTSRN